MIDYEKKYKEALEQAKKELMACGNMDCDAARLIFRLFPQLRESEDDRIRKFICGIIDNLEPKDFVGVKKMDVLRWLEKQKEPENVSATTMSPSCWAEEPSLQKEQKPRILNGSLEEEIKRYYETYGNGRGGFDYMPYPKFADIVETFVSEYGVEQKPAEWSEEDDMLMDELESYILYDKEFNDEQKSWRIKRLKSLRPHFQWKPSEEQMKALEHFVDFHSQQYKNTGTRWSDYEALLSLQTDLLKLK